MAKIYINGKQVAMPTGFRPSIGSSLSQGRNPTYSPGILARPARTLHGVFGASPTAAAVQSSPRAGLRPKKKQEQAYQITPGVDAGVATYPLQTQAMVEGGEGPYGDLGEFFGPTVNPTIKRMGLPMNNGYVWDEGENIMAMGDTFPYNTVEEGDNLYEVTRGQRIPRKRNGPHMRGLGADDGTTDENENFDYSQLVVSGVSPTDAVAQVRAAYNDPDFQPHFSNSVGTAVQATLARLFGGAPAPAMAPQQAPTIDMGSWLSNAIAPIAKAAGIPIPGSTPAPAAPHPQSPVPVPVPQPSGFMGFSNNTILLAAVAAGGLYWAKKTGRLDGFSKSKR
jgi:hypothetical protein